MSRLLLWHWGRRGGGPRYTLELARALRDQGTHDVHLSISRQCEIFDDLVALDLPTHIINTYTDKVSAALSLFRLPAVRRDFRHYLSANRIETVFCTLSHLWNIAMTPAIRQAEARYVLALHEAVPHPGDNYFVREWMLAREIAAADGIVTLTRHVRNQVHEVYGYPLDRTWMAPLGVFDYSLADKGRSFPVGRPMRLLFFGRILPYKGLDLLLRAFPILEREFPGIELTVVGSGDMTPYTRAVEQCKNIVIENQWIPEANIGPVFDRADLVVVPYIEASQSAVVVTAFAAGLPIVATPVGGLVEQVQHLETGYVAREPSPEAVADAIRHLLQDPGLYVRCSENALRQAKETLDWNVIGKLVADGLTQAAGKPFRTP